jgi:hypothetical protein
MLYAPVDRETMAILGGRRFALHGIRPGDLVLVRYALGLSNGGMAPREALWRYTGAVPVMAGSGATTPTRRQVELIKAWKINVILGCQRDGYFGRKRRSAPLERCSQRSHQSLALESLAHRERVNVEEIPHAAVYIAEHHHRVQLFCDRGLRTVSP